MAYGLRRGRFKNAYEFVNLGALKMSTLYNIRIVQCMGKIFCVEIQRYTLKYYTKYLIHTMKDVWFVNWWKFKSPLAYKLSIYWAGSNTGHLIWIELTRSVNFHTNLDYSVSKGPFELCSVSSGFVLLSFSRSTTKLSICQTYSSNTALACRETPILDEAVIGLVRHFQDRLGWSQKLRPGSWAARLNCHVHSYRSHGSQVADNWSIACGVY